MSWKVVEEVIEHARAKHGTRLVELAIAEIAHHDGVAFVSQDARKGREGRGESISERTRLSTRQVERCVATACTLDELEVRGYWVGRMRLLAYRVIVGRLRDLSADHERLRFQFGIELDRPFSSVAELALSRPERELLQTGQIVGSSAPREDDELSGRERADDPTFATRRPDISDADDPTSAPPYAGASEQGSSESNGPNSSLTTSEKNPSEVVPGDLAGGTADGRSEELLRAFAEEVGVWPSGRREWGGWMSAFAQLAEAGATVDELRVRCRSYREQRGSDVSPFGLAKQFQLIGVALERKFFALARWVTDTSWRLEADDVAWVLDEAADKLTPEELTRLLQMAANVRAAHANVGSEVLRWVELKGWALDEREWRVELGTRVAGLRTEKPEIKRRAGELRLELRQAVARLQFGIATQELAS